MVEVGLIEARVGLIVVEVHVAKMRADVTIGIVSAIVEGAEDEIKLETERDCAEIGMESVGTVEGAKRGVKKQE